MKKNNLDKIKRSKIHKLTGDVPYTVLHLNIERDDFYYMRTGSLIGEAIEKATTEFKKKEFTEKEFNPKYNTGFISFQDEEAVIYPYRVQGMNFWVAEGLVFTYFNDKKLQSPKIRTARVPTKKLFEIIYYKPHEAVESDRNLAELLTDPEKTCRIDIAKVLKDPKDISDKFKLEDAAYRGGSPAELAIMNYGYIWGKHSTFFEDPDIKQWNNSGQWYQLLNKETFSKDERKWQKKVHKKELPKLNTVCKIKGYTFSEVDKVMPSDQYFFDGSLKDVFEILKESGVKFKR